MGNVTSARDQGKGIGEQVSGDIKKAVGEVAGDEELQAEGRQERAKGLARERVGEAKRDLDKLEGSG